MVASGKAHLRALADAVLRLDTGRLEAWGRVLAGKLDGGGRLLVAGNGGSAAEAQHLSAELVGHFRNDRVPLSALALNADSSSVTAIGNDFGFDEVFARQVRAHGRRGDVLLLLSTSGRSANLLRAVEAGRALGLLTWALTGPEPNELALRCDAAVCVQASSAATVQECHLAAVHVLCGAIDAELAAQGVATEIVPGTPGRSGRPVESGSAASPVRDVQPSGRRLVVVGDALLDRDVEGDVVRLSPDAPVPVVVNPRTVVRPGGAGLAALMAAQELGWAVTLVTALGTDEAGGHVRELLAVAGVEVVDAGVSGATAVKTRIRARGRTVVRVDEALCGVELGALPPRAHEVLAAADAVLVCDYGRGVSGHGELRALLAEAARRAPVVWDPHPKGALPVDGVALVVPNVDEIRGFVGEVPGRGFAADIQRARVLLGSWPVRQVAVTRGGDGAVLVCDEVSPALVVPGRTVAAADECGAGDRFAVAAALMLGERRLPSQAVVMAVEAATEYVAQGGPAGLASQRGKPVPGEDALALVERVRSRGGRVVGAGGCFDLLHTGHVSLLEQARRLGDCLVVCLNSDASVARLKGASRPVVSEEERAAMLRALVSVDGVLIFEEDTPDRVLSLLRPDIWVKGGDYGSGRIPESALVESWGGQVVVVAYLRGRSTTSLIEEAVRREGAR